MTGAGACGAFLGSRGACPSECQLNTRRHFLWSDAHVTTSWALHHHMLWRSIPLSAFSFPFLLKFCFGETGTETMWGLFDSAILLLATTKYVHVRHTMYTSMVFKYNIVKNWSPYLLWSILSTLTHLWLNCNLRCFFNLSAQVVKDTNSFSSKLVYWL